MQTISHEDLTNLAAITGDGCVSIYMPLRPDLGNSQQDPIRYKNLVHNAIAQLRASGMRQTQVEQLLAPAITYLQDNAFFQQSGRGLAFFVAPGFSRCFFLAESVAELVVTGKHLHLRPLLPLVLANRTFYILTLNQRHIRLLKCDRSEYQEVLLENIPASVKDAMQEEVPGRALQFHYGQSTGRNSRERSPIFHGQDAGQQERREKIRLFFIQVNAGVTGKLKNTTAPLVLAGVQYLLDIYRMVNNYNHLLPEEIALSSNSRSDQQLQHHGWQLILTQLRHEAQDQLQRYNQISHSRSDLASDRLKDILPAAHYGKIDALLVPSSSRQYWGEFDLQAQRLHYRGHADYASSDLIDEAATQAMLHGGQVYFLDADAEQRGTDAKPKAIFRL